MATACPLLRKLDLSWSTISDSGLEVFLKASAVLESLNLEGCKSLTASISIYLPMCAPRSLRHLDLSWVNAVSDQVVQIILEDFRHVPDFHIVDYYGNSP